MKIVDISFSLLLLFECSSYASAATLRKVSKGRIDANEEVVDDEEYDETLRKDTTDLDVIFGELNELPRRGSDDSMDNNEETEEMKALEMSTKEKIEAVEESAKIQIETLENTALMKVEALKDKEENDEKEENDAFLKVSAVNKYSLNEYYNSDDKDDTSEDDYNTSIMARISSTGSDPSFLDAVFSSRDDAAVGCGSIGKKLCSKDEISGSEKCAAGWLSNGLGFWMSGKYEGCGNAGYNDWSSSAKKARAYCCEWRDSRPVHLSDTFSSRSEASNGCKSIGKKLCSRDELRSHGHCAAGWLSNGLGFWMNGKYEGCGNAGYNDWSSSENTARAYCCKPQESKCTDSLENWYDKNEANCGHYSQTPLHCLFLDNDDYRNFGKTAIDVCCACGGGQRDPTPQPTMAPQNQPTMLIAYTGAYGEPCESNDDCKSELSCNQYVGKCDKREPGGMLALCSSDEHCLSPSFNKCGGSGNVGKCQRPVGGYCGSSVFNYYCATGVCDASKKECAPNLGNIWNAIRNGDINSQDYGDVFCLDAPIDNNRMLIWECNQQNENQQFDYYPNGQLVLRRDPSFCISNDGARMGSSVSLSKCNYNDQTQKWIMDDSTGFIHARNSDDGSDSNLCLTVSGTGYMFSGTGYMFSAVNGQRLFLWTCGLTSFLMQRWGNIGQSFLLQTNHDSNYCLEVNPGDFDQVHIKTCSTNNNRQKLIFDHYGRLVVEYMKYAGYDFNYNFCLQYIDQNRKSLLLRKCNNDENQIWKFEGGKFKTPKNNCISVNVYELEEGRNINLRTCDSTNDLWVEQKWNIQYI